MIPFARRCLVRVLYQTSDLVSMLFSFLSVEQLLTCHRNKKNESINSFCIKVHVT